MHFLPPCIANQAVMAIWKWLLKTNAMCIFAPISTKRVKVHKHNCRQENLNKSVHSVNLNAMEWHQMTLCKSPFQQSVWASACRKQTFLSTWNGLGPHSASLSRERLAKTDSRLEYWLTSQHLITVRTYTHEEWVYGAADKTAGKRKGHGYRG